MTGTFEFSHGKTFNLYIQGESAPIGVTGLHPIWSVDRLNWVEVWDLNVGERVQVECGTRVVEKVEVRGEEVVFNIEVEGEHCYRVGEQGVLVHNASTDPVLIGQGEDRRVKPFAQQKTSPEGRPYRIYKFRSPKFRMELNVAWTIRQIKNAKCLGVKIYDLGADPIRPSKGQMTKQEILDSAYWTAEIAFLEASQFMRKYNGRYVFIPDVPSSTQTDVWIPGRLKEYTGLYEWNPPK